MKMKKTILSLSLVFALLLTGCSQSSEPSEPGKLVMSELSVYTNANFPPFEYMKGTEVVGVDMEIAKAIAEELDAELKITDADFEGIITGLASGKGDIAISGFTITAERKKEVDFSNPYINSIQYLVLPKDSAIKTMEDLAGKKVATALGYTGDLILGDEIADGVLKDKNVTKTAVNNALDGSLDVVNNKFDAMIMDEFVAKKIASENEALTAIELVYSNGTLVAEEYGVAVPKDNPELLSVVNKVIDKLIADKKIEEWVVSHSNA